MNGLQRLRDLSTRKVITAFRRAGWVPRNAGKHTVLTKPGEISSLSIPRHRKIKAKLLASLIKKARLTVEEFLELYD